MGDPNVPPQERRRQNWVLFVILAMNGALLLPLNILLFNLFSDDPRDNLWSVVGMASGAGLLFAVVVVALLGWVRRLGRSWLNKYGTSASDHLESN